MPFRNVPELAHSGGLCRISLSAKRFARLRPARGQLDPVNSQETFRFLQSQGRFLPPALALTSVSNLHSVQNAPRPADS